uniref:Dimethylargininase n=1 Tax=Chlamydomonas leiostraca TaxID=1034604 RepID=A0A7S0RHG3_9CHLO
MAANWLHPTHAITRGLPRSFANALQMSAPPVSIDVDVARQQHDAYNNLIMKLVPNWVGLPADESVPDCLFVEDTAFFVPIEGTSQTTKEPLECVCVITRPGADSRKPEVPPVHNCIVHMGMPKDQVFEVTEPGTIDGGDVMYTPQALWIGLSKRTNQAAVDQVASFLQAYNVPVVAFSMGSGGHVLHLKSVVTLLDSDCLLVADNDTGRHVVAQAEAHPLLKGKFKYVYVPDQLAANVLRIGSHVVMQAGFPASGDIVRAECAARGLTVHTLGMGETAKADGALTCCSLLFRLP